MKFVYSAALFAFMSVFAAGCGKTIDVIHTDNVVTNNVSFRSFSDETYVWETWTYGTNRADRAVFK